jgi:hypothetical protein
MIPIILLDPRHWLKKEAQDLELPAAAIVSQVDARSIWEVSKRFYHG